MSDDRRTLNRVYLACIACIVGALVLLYYANTGELHGTALYIAFAALTAAAIALYRLLNRS